MEFEKPIYSDKLTSDKTGHASHRQTRNNCGRSPDDLSSRMESFHEAEPQGAPKGDSVQQKLSWLRSQIIGGDIDFDTPFGKRKLTYADHTASGRCLLYIENYIIHNVLPLYGGGEDDALILLDSGTTTAIKRLQEVMGIAIPSSMREKVLKCLGNDERWVVFVGPYEHHSNILSWRQSLAEVVEIGLDDNGLLDMKALRDQLEFYRSTNRPLLGSFSACSNVTGISSDTRALARLLHQYGSFACFDFAANGPYVKIDMRSGEIDGYDAIFLSPHKFLGGPGSTGILLMNKALYQLTSSPPSTCGGGTVDYVNGFNDKDTIYVDDIEEREDAGTPAITQKIKAALTFWIKEYIGYELIERQEQSYIKQALERLLPNPYMWVLGNTTAKRQAILSFLVYTTTNSSSADMNTKNSIDSKETRGLNLWRETGNKRDKPLHGSFVAKLLNDLFGIQARGGCACAGPYGHSLLKVDESLSLAIRSAVKRGYSGVKPGWTRVSFPYYMSKEELEFILEVLEFIATYGQRFLPFYHFNWKSGVWTFKKKAWKETFLGNEYNCLFCGSLPGNPMKALNLECTEFEEHNPLCSKDPTLFCKYTNYLETAKHLATLLPKFPPHRPIPKDIDPNHVLFRV